MGYNRVWKQTGKLKNPIFAVLDRSSALIPNDADGGLMRGGKEKR